MTTQQAKKDAITRMKTMLLPEGYAWTEVTAKTVDFTDLARERPIVVYVKGLSPNAMPLFDAIRADRTKGYVLVAR